MKTFLILFVALTMAAFVVEGKGPNKGGGGGGGFDPKTDCSVKTFWKEKGPNKRYHVTMIYTGNNPQNLNNPYYMFSSDGKAAVNCESLFKKCECAIQSKGPVAEISCVTGDTNQLSIVPGKAYVQVNYSAGPDGAYCENLLLANAPELENGGADLVKVNTILLHHTALDIYQLISPIPTKQPATDVKVEYLSDSSSWMTVAGENNTNKTCDNFLSAANCLVSIAQPEMPPVESAKVRLSIPETGTSSAITVLSPVALAESIDAGALKEAMLKPYAGAYKLDNVLFRTINCSAPSQPAKTSPWRLSVARTITTAGRAASIKSLPTTGQLNIFESGNYFLSIAAQDKKTVTQEGVVDFSGSNAEFYISSGELNRGFLAGYFYAMTFNGPQLELTLSDPDAQPLACTADAIQSITLKRMN